MYIHIYKSITNSNVYIHRHMDTKTDNYNETYAYNDTYDEQHRHIQNTYTYLNKAKYIYTNKDIYISIYMNVQMLRNMVRQ